MRIFFCALLLSFPAFSEQRVSKPQEISYESLIDADDDRGGTSHVICLKQIFDALKIKTLMEFGMGYSTKYFLDSCKKVISVEVITHGYGPERMKRFIEFYKGYSNWVPVAYFSGFQGDMSWSTYKYISSDAVYKASSYQCSTWLHYALVDPFYLQELEDFLKNLTKYNKVEAALIEPILYLRGDLVQLLFDKVSIIIAHNTESRISKMENAFGYVRVKTPENYEEIYVPTKQGGKVQGTTVWIVKKAEYEPLIQLMKDFSSQQSFL